MFAKTIPCKAICTLKMPKLLFSKIRIYEFKDLLQNRKRTRGSYFLIKNIQLQMIDDDSFPINCKEGSTTIQPTLESFLKDKGYFAAFRAFLQSEFSEENIEFWLACQEYRETTSTADLSWKATKIYQDFLHPQAQKEVNIDHHICEKIRRAMKAPGPCCFDEAVIHVYKLMERDSFPRFLMSVHYLGQEARTLW